MTIYVVRHGQTDWNIIHKVQGRRDIPLNETGKKQALETMELLSGKEIDLIICSPLSRAKQTAEIIAGETLPIIYDDRISERDFGEFEGKRKEEFNVVKFWTYGDSTIYEKAEDVKSFLNRVQKFLDEIIKKYKDKKILLVTHAGIAIAIECYFNGIPIDKRLMPLGMKNGEVKEYII